MVLLFGLSVISLVFYPFLDQGIWVIILYFALVFAFLFAIVYYHTKHYIWIQLTKVYRSSLLENEPLLKNTSEELDLETFVGKIKNFVDIVQG